MCPIKRGSVDRERVEGWRGILVDQPDAAGVWRDRDPDQAVGCPIAVLHGIDQQFFQREFDADNQRGRRAELCAAGTKKAYHLPQFAQTGSKCLCAAGRWGGRESHGVEV